MPSPVAPLVQIGAVGVHAVMAPLEAHPRWLVIDDLPVIVNADGANGQTWVHSERAAALGLDLAPGQQYAPLAAYHPLDFGPRSKWMPPGRRRSFGLDAPENGGRSLDDAWGWYIENGHAVIQGDRDPAPGYLVSTTKLRNHELPESDPRAYHDSAGAPGWTLPSSDLSKYGIELGDLALIEFGPYRQWAQACDWGHHGRLVELSVWLCNQLGIPDCARSGGVSSGVKITAIPRSRVHIVDSKGRPRPGTREEIAQAGEAAARAAGLEIGH